MESDAIHDSAWGGCGPTKHYKDKVSAAYPRRICLLVSINRRELQGKSIMIAAINVKIDLATWLVAPAC
jgi:hypothetical protein